MELSLQSTIKTELITTITQLTNELDTAFEYVDKNIVEKLREYYGKLDSDPDFFAAQTTLLQNSLGSFETDISHIMAPTRKIKSNDFKFLNKLSLFDNILNFQVFKPENKNTKRDLVKYLKTLYMSCCFLNLNMNADMSLDELTAELNSFVSSIQNQPSYPRNKP